jgi:hypothetical protein
VQNRDVSVYKSFCATEVSVKYTEPVLHLIVSVYKSFCVHLTVVSVDYIEPVLHLFLSVYKSFVQHLEVSVFKSLCCICAFLSTRAFVLHLCLSAVYKSSVLHLDVFAYKSPVYAISGGAQFTIFFLRFFQNRFFCFGCFDKCLKHRNKPKIILFGFTSEAQSFHFLHYFTIESDE